MAMKIRLGEDLINSGLITEEQLQKALRRQLMMGGKMGTNLVELRFISEDQLETALSKIYSIPKASGRYFSDIPPDAINSIPKEFAIKYRIIPIIKDQKNITIAMENPNNIAVMDEVRFMTGCKVTQTIASEIRIVFALEKYYGYPRDIRYIEITPPKDQDFVVDKGSTTPKPVPAVPKAVIQQTAASQPARTAPLQSAKKEDQEEWGDWNNPTHETPAVGSGPQSTKVGANRDEDQLGEWGDWDIGGEEEPMEVTEIYEPEAVHDLQNSADVKNASREISFQDTVQKFADITTRDEAIGAALDYISQYVDNVIFFVVSAGEAKAWHAEGKDIDPKIISDLKISFALPSIFLTVKNSEEPYIGKMSSYQLDDEFIEKIGGNRPKTVYLVPVMVKTKMVSILYMDSNREILPERVSEINSIIKKLSISFEILLLQKKAEGKKS